MTIAFRVPAVPDFNDDDLAARVQRRLDAKTKPLGSLGRLEALAVQIALVQGRERPRLESPQLVVFAGDHGIAAQGVSAYPAEVTAQMVVNMLAGGAAVSVLARQHGIALHVADVGVGSALAVSEARPGTQFHPLKVAPGTADASLGPAMSEAACAQAMARGAALVARLPGRVVLLGEMGIGNSSAAALLLARLAGLPLDACVGRGTGLDDAGLARKTAVLARVLARSWDAPSRIPVQPLPPRAPHRR